MGKLADLILMVWKSFWWFFVSWAIGIVTWVTLLALFAGMDINTPVSIVGDRVGNPFWGSAVEIVYFVSAAVAIWGFAAFCIIMLAASSAVSTKEAIRVLFGDESKTTEEG